MISPIRNIRIALLTATWLLLPFVSVEPAQAFFRNYNEAWCADLGDGVIDCAYFTQQQCRAAASGNGNFCYPNPRYTGPVEPRKPRRNTNRG